MTPTYMTPFLRQMSFNIIVPIYTNQFMAVVVRIINLQDYNVFVKRILVSRLQFQIIVCRLVKQLLIC